MKATILIAIFTFFLTSIGFSQTKLPIVFKAEKQSMSTPMTTLEEVLFTNYYNSKPVNVKFDGSQLNMFFDNGATIVKTNVTEVNREKFVDEGALMEEKFVYTDNSNVNDTISYVINYSAGFVQMILPTKNSKGEYIGYTSYRKFVSENDLALNQ